MRMCLRLNLFNFMICAQINTCIEYVLLSVQKAGIMLFLSIMLLD